MDPFYLAIILYVIALVLAFVDLFIPSGGMLIIMSVLTASACVLFGFRSGTNMGMAMLAVVLGSVPIFAFLAIKIWPMTPLGKRVILPAQAHSLREKRNALEELVGLVVETDSALLPSGHLRIHGKSRNAVASAGIIEAGQRVEIVAVRDFSLVVTTTQKPLSVPQQLVPEAEEDEKPPQDGKSLLEMPADEFGLDSID